MEDKETRRPPRLITINSEVESDGVDKLPVKKKHRKTETSAAVDSSRDILNEIVPKKEKKKRKSKERGNARRRNEGA